MSDNKRIIPIRPVVEVVASDEKDDLEDDDRTVVQSLETLFDGFDDSDVELLQSALDPAHSIVAPVPTPPSTKPAATSPRPGISPEGQLRVPSPVAPTQAPAQEDYQTSATRDYQRSAAQIEQTPPPFAQDHHTPPPFAQDHHTPPSGYQTQPHYQTPSPPGHYSSPSHQSAPGQANMGMYTPVPGQMHHTPSPVQVQTPVPAMYHNSGQMPAMYHTPSPEHMHSAMYHTPLPEHVQRSMHPFPAPGSAAPKSRTTLLVVVGAVVLMLAGVGVGSILFANKSNDGQNKSPSTADDSSNSPTVAKAMASDADAAVLKPVSEVPHVEEPIAAPAPDAQVAEQPSIEPAVPVLDPPVSKPAPDAGVVDAAITEPAPDRAAPRPRSSFSVKSTMAGKVTTVFLQKRTSVRRGAKLFIITENSGVSDAKLKELTRAVDEAEKMVKEDPELYGPFLAKAKRALSSATRVKSITIRAKRPGIAVPAVREGDSVRDGQVLAKID